MAQQIMGNRILGGIGSPGGGLSTAYGEGVNTALTQRTSRQQMVERDQMMGLRASQEQREQERFKLALQDRAAAQARAAQAASQAAQRKALMQQYGGALTGGAPGLVIGAPGVSAPTPASAPTAGLTLAPGAGSPVTGGAGTPRLGGGGNADMLGQMTNAEFLSGELPQAGVAAGVDPRGRMQMPGVPGVTAPTPAPTMDYNAFIRAAQAGQPITQEQFVNSVEAGLLDNQQAADVQAMLDSGYIPTAQDVAAATAPGLTPVSNLGYTPGPGYRAVEDYIRGIAGETRGEREARREEYAARGAVSIDTTSPSGEVVTVEVGEGPVLSFGGLRNPDGGSPVDFVLGQPVGSGAPAPNIPREPPRISAAITQGFSERERLVEAYNAFVSAGLTDDATDFLQAIQKLDQTLIRLQGEQAINDLSIGSPDRAAQLLSYYYGADVQPVLNSEGMYDLYVNGQPVENDGFIDLRPDQMGDILRPFFDEQYREAMATGREAYLTEAAKKKAERDMAEEENPGFETERTMTVDGTDVMVMVNPAGDYRFVWFEVDDAGNRTVRVQATTQADIANTGF
jgi:hypothetical protein